MYIALKFIETIMTFAHQPIQKLTRLQYPHKGCGNLEYNLITKLYRCMQPSVEVIYVGSIPIWRCLTVLYHVRVLLGNAHALKCDRVVLMKKMVLSEDEIFLAASLEYECNSTEYDTDDDILTCCFSTI